MYIGSRVMYYGFLYLYKKKEYTEALSYIDRNKEDLIKELKSELLVKALSYMIKINSDQKDYDLPEVLNFTKEYFDNLGSMTEEDKSYICAVLLDLLGIQFIDYSKPSLYSDPKVYEYIVKLLDLKVLKPIDMVGEIWLKTLKIWQILGSEEKEKCMEECIKPFATVIEAEVNNESVLNNYMSEIQENV